MTLAVLLVLLFCFSAIPQDTDKSLAFKKNRPQKKYSLFYQPDLSYQIQHRFNLIREANAGNALAQHELGLRYLLGEDGLEADTIQGAYWVGKAAMQDLPAACFNYGILLINGWGVNWNPFLAYDYFLKAAKDGMPQAQHIIGILHTDNLIVRRDYREAYHWIKKASDQGYAPANETKKELEKYLPASFHNGDDSLIAKNVVQQSRNDTSLSSQLGLVFIDFEAVQDTIKDVTEAHLINDLFHESNRTLADTLGLKQDDTNLTEMNPDRISILNKYAESGNAEAFTVLGYLYSKGIFLELDKTKAIENYILASQLSYPRAKMLLLKSITQNLISELLSSIKNQHNPDAMFSIYGLWSLGLYSNLIEKEALNYLLEATKLNHMNSVIELANRYYSDKANRKNMTAGIDLFKQAAFKGSFQAQIRLAAINIIDGINIEPVEKSIQVLNEANEYGSLLAQITLAFAYENGVGVRKSKAEAVKFYRLTAQRGSESGYEELKRIYNEIRPNEKKFIVN